MSQCSNSGLHWEMVTQVSGGPSSDHTSLPGGNDTGRFSKLKIPKSSYFVRMNQDKI